jgi:hypothetical protein
LPQGIQLERDSKELFYQGRMDNRHRYMVGILQDQFADLAPAAVEGAVSSNMQACNDFFKADGPRAAYFVNQPEQSVNEVGSA